MWNYTDKVMDHFMNPRNVGEVENPDGIGEVGNAACGDALKLTFKLDENGRIADVKFKTFGCASAIASSSALTELIKGMTIEEAAKVAQAHDFITSFTDGYQHRVSTGGTNLSGGQRQRLLISRAIASRPEILILDDSSSALDYKTDANLRKALSTALPGTTVITVAQRVSSVKNCSLILVIEKGEIIGAGTHDTLMKDCAEYKEIGDSQMGGAFLD